MDVLLQPVVLCLACVVILLVLRPPVCHILLRLVVLVTVRGKVGTVVSCVGECVWCVAV